MAAKWEGFMQDGDRYNLQYRTQKDDKVRPEYAALDRKITAELALTHEVPDDRMGVKHDENDGTENKQEQYPQQEVKSETTVKTVKVHTTDIPQGYKPSMVAEPNLVIQWRQVRRVTRLDIPVFDNPQQTDQASRLGQSFVFLYKRLNSS